MKLKYKLVDNFQRSVLAEGRNYGMGFSFVKKNDESTFETVYHSPSPCRDYLHESISSNRTGANHSIYGLKTHDTKLFNDVPNAYLAFTICKKGAGNPQSYETYTQEIKSLEKNINHLKKFIHFFEEKFKVEGRTEFIKIKKNLYVSVLPLFWTQYSYLISLYSLLLRVGAYNTGEKEPMAFLQEFEADYQDTSYLKTAIPKINRMINGEIPVQTNWKNIHNGGGIVNFKFPEIKVEKEKVPEVKSEIAPKIKEPKKKVDLPEVKAYSKPEVIKVFDDFENIWKSL